MQSLRLLCGDLRWVDRCFYFSLLALDICVLWFVPDWDGVPLMVQIHFCSCNKHDWGYMLAWGCVCCHFCPFFSLWCYFIIISAAAPHIYTFLKLLMFCSIWDAVCLSVSSFLLFSSLFFGFIHSINVLYKKTMLHSISFYTFQDFQDIFEVLPSSFCRLYVPSCQPFGVPWVFFFLTNNWFWIPSMVFNIQVFSIWEISL